MSNKFASLSENNEGFTKVSHVKPKTSNNGSSGSNQLAHTTQTKKNGSPQFQKSPNFQSKPQNKQHRSGPSEEELQERERERREKTRKANAISLKEECKKQIENACNNNVGVLTRERIESMITDICENRGSQAEEEVRTVRATVLSIVIKHVPMMESGHSDFIKLLAPLIDELMCPTKISSQEKETHNAMGYDLLNCICWPGVTSVPNAKGYLEAVETLITVCKCNVLAINAKGETALSSYLLAVNKGLAPKIVELRKLLSTGIQDAHLEKIVTSLMNKFTIQNAQVLGNIFKLAYCKCLPLLVTKIFNDLLNVHPHSKKNGQFEYISSQIRVCKAMMMQPISNDGWETIIREKINNLQQAQQAYVSLLTNLCEKAVGEIENVKRKIQVLEEKEKEGKEKEGATIAIDAIGAIVGEVSVEIGSNVYSSFVSQLLNNSKDEHNQKMILSATAHVVSSLQEKKASKDVLFQFLNESILNKLTSSSLSTFVVFNLESILGNFLNLGSKVKLSEIKHNFAKNSKSNLSESKISEPVKVNEIEDSLSNSNLIDTEAHESSSPSFMKKEGIEKTVKGQDGAYTDSEVDDWAYSLEKSLKKNDNEKQRMIVTIIYMLTNTIFHKGNFSDEKLIFFKTLIDDVFGEELVKAALATFINATNGKDETQDLWDTRNGFQYFTCCLKLYMIDF
jgi:hypothetical protein